MGLAADLDKKVVEEKKASPPLLGAVSIREMMQREPHRPVKIQVQGEAKSGKTQFILSVFPWLESKGLKPEQCMMFLLDCDDGTLPLIERGIVKPEWLDCIKYAKCNTMDDVLRLTDEAIPILQEWKQKNGAISAWLCVDNMKFVWEWTRDKFALDVYGMTEAELALKKRIEAQSQGKKMLPTFNQMTDYAVINPIHNHWAEKVKLSGINFIWTTPEKTFTKKNKEGAEETITYATGQSDNEFRVDDVLRLYTSIEVILDTDSNSPTFNKQIQVVVYYADLLGSRTAKRYFMKAPNPTFSKFMGWVAQHKGV